MCIRDRYVGVLATGYNVVDMAAAKKKGITVTNIPAYGTNAVAQMTFALLLEMCHHVWAHSEEVKKGAWINSPDFCFWNYPLIAVSYTHLDVYKRQGSRTVPRFQYRRDRL